MAAVKNADIPEIFGFMGEFWGYVKKYYIPEETDSYWEAVMAEASELGRKYPDRFCTMQMLSFLDYLEEKQCGKLESWRRKEQYWEDFLKGRRKEPR